MNKATIKKEITFKTARSSGAGGQHVNKVASKVVACFMIQDSEGLNVSEKNRLVEKLSNKLTKEGAIMVSVEESRSQFRNKALSVQRILEILETNLIKTKRRRPTQPTKASKLRKLDEKKRQSEKKQWRQKPGKGEF